MKTLNKTTIWTAIAAFVFSLNASVALSAGENDLTRDHALSVLNKKGSIGSMYEEVPIGGAVNIEMMIAGIRNVDARHAKFMDGLYGGLHRSKLLKFVTGTNTFKEQIAISVTREGFKHGRVIKKASYGYSKIYRFRMADRKAVSITGISRTGPVHATVKFGYRFADFSPAGKEIVASSSKAKIFNGSARFQLYDDGWRVISFTTGG